MSSITIRLFGRFDVLRDGAPSALLGARRARELLGYLALHRSRPQPREALAGLLWEDASPEQARKYLRQALWQVQTALQCDGAGPPALEVDAEWIQLNECASLDIDVARFEGAVCGCRGVAGGHLRDAGRARLEEAVALYRGDLLDGWYQGWCLVERERMQIDYLEALEKLVDCCEAQCDCERGLAFARRVLAIDPTREQAHRSVMQLHLLAGNRTEALRAFERCERVLQQEFGVRPSRRTLTIHEAMRSDDAAPALPPAVGREQLQPLMELLEHVRLLLSGIEARLRDELPAARASD